MKKCSVDIKDDDVLTEVYRQTANMAKQRGDADAVATSDDVDLLEGFIADGKALLMRGFGRYATEDMQYEMPENWLDAKKSVTELSTFYVVNYVLKRWYEQNGTGERFEKTANEALLGIIQLLNKRMKPI